jgi:hypothetical protein
LARYNSVNTQAQQVAATPFQQYSTDPNAFVAPVTPEQNTGIGTINQAGANVNPMFNTAANTAVNAYQGAVPGLQAAGQTGAAGFGGAQNYLNAATGYTAAGGQAVDPSQITPGAIGQYMNPYLGTVLGSTEALINQQNQQQQAGQMGTAISSGAFGGDRSGIAAAVLAGQQQLAAGQTYSGITSDAYNQALATAQQQQGVGLAAGQANRAALQQTGQSLAGLGAQGFGQAQTEAQLQAALAGQGFGMGQTEAQTLAGLAQGQQQAGLAQGQAELGAGQVQQQTEQAGKTALYNQFLQQQSYPFQTAQFLANIAEGTGALSGSTTTAIQPQSIFSDERLKEDMTPVGKGFDGANIYRFRYKGDPTWRMGLSAQETERRHPEAVAEAPSGFKAVDYGRATQEAAHLGGFARAVNDNDIYAEPQRVARQAGGYQGFGGVAYPSGVNQFDLAGMLQAQEGMYGPYAESGLYGGKAGGAPHGGSSYVPAGNMPISHLSPAAAPKMSNTSALHQAAQAADDVKTAREGAATISKGFNTIKDKLSGEDTMDSNTPGHQGEGTVAQASTDLNQGLSQIGGTTPAADSSTPPPSDDSTTPAPTDGGEPLGDYARGGFARARRRQDGGGTDDFNSNPQPDDPYDPQGPSLHIPDTASKVTPLEPAKPPSSGDGSSSTMGDLKDIATIAKMFMRSGGRVGRQGYGVGGWLKDVADTVGGFEGGLFKDVTGETPQLAHGGRAGFRAAAGGRQGFQDGGSPDNPDLAGGFWNAAGQFVSGIPTGFARAASNTANYAPDLPTAPAKGAGEMAGSIPGVIVGAGEQALNDVGTGLAHAGASFGRGLFNQPNPTPVAPANPADVPVSTFGPPPQQTAATAAAAHAQAAQHHATVARQAAHQAAAAPAAPPAGFAGASPSAATPGAGFSPAAATAPPQTPDAAMANAQAGQGPVDVGALDAAYGASGFGAAGSGAPGAPAAATAPPSAPTGGGAATPSGQAPQHHGGIGSALAGAAEGLVGYDPKSGKFNTDQLMRLFSGIAAMGATPTVHPLFALSQGLGGYANAYYGQQQERAEIARTEAQTGQIQAAGRDTDANIVARVAAANGIPAGWTLDKGPATGGGRTIQGEPTSYNPSGIWHAVPAASALGPGSPGSATWAGATPLTPDIAFDRYNRNQATMSPQQRQDNSQAIQRTLSAGPQAAGSLVNDLETADTVSALKDSHVSGDMLAPIKQRYVSTINGIARMLGAPELASGDVTNAQLLTKLQTMGAMADPATKASIEHLQAGLISRPGVQLDKAAQAALAARILVNDRSVIDSSNTYRDIGNSTTVPNSFMASDAQQENVRRHAPQTYETNVNDLGHLMLDKRWNTWRSIMGRDPSDEARQGLVQRLDGKYGQGFSESYLSGRGM